MLEMGKRGLLTWPAIVAFRGLGTGLAIHLLGLVHTPRYRWPVRVGGVCACACAVGALETRATTLRVLSARLTI